VKKLVLPEKPEAFFLYNMAQCPEEERSIIYFGHFVTCVTNVKDTSTLLVVAYLVDSATGTELLSSSWSQEDGEVYYKTPCPGPVWHGA
jgi:hypothetical protein